MTQKTKLLILLLVVAFFLSAFFIMKCNRDTNEREDNGEFSFEIISSSMLKDEKLQAWLESSYQKKGSHSISSTDGYQYLLISGGEQPTGGYSVELVGNEKKDETWIFFAELNTPGEKQIVTQALTYPHLLLKIKVSEKITVKGQLDFAKKEAEADRDYKSATGTFVGQIDNNSVEIIVDKNPLFPESDDPMVFRLSENVKEFFDINSDHYKNIEPDERIKFHFRSNKNGQLEIVEIEKLE